MIVGAGKAAPPTAVITVRAGGDANLSYLVRLSREGCYVCIDPSYGGRVIERELLRAGGSLEAILLTHAHGDHIADLNSLRSKHGSGSFCHHLESGRITGVTPIMSEGAAGCPDGVEAIFTPGHTPGSTCYRIGDCLFTGDTLFIDWIGRTDFPGGDPLAMFKSLAKLRALQDNLMIYPGHDYGEVPCRSLGEEKRLNRFLACEDYGAFLRLLPDLV